MKNKPIIIVTALLLIISVAASGVGYMESAKKKDVVPPKPEEKITYEYYLDDILQDAIPNNMTTDENGNQVSSNTYVFTRYQCDNNITGNFNTDTWTFEPSEIKNATCKLYFAQSNYEISLTITNGVYEEENPKIVARESDAALQIVPSEGYEFSEVTCNNNKTATYDVSTNTLNISSIMENVACKVDFEIKKLKMNVTVKNGKENTTETANYGDSVSAVVQPNSGYENPKIECTNDQKATFEDNKLVIEKLTNNTTCTVTFSKIKPKTFKFKINLPDNNTVTVTDENGVEKEENIVTITNGNTETSYEDGTDASFSLKILDGYSLKLDCGGVYPSKELIDEVDKNITNYTFLKITKDVTCKVTATKKD